MRGVVTECAAALGSAGRHEGVRAMTAHRSIRPPNSAFPRKRGRASSPLLGAGEVTGGPVRGRLGQSLRSMGWLMRRSVPRGRIRSRRALGILLATAATQALSPSPGTAQTEIPGTYRFRVLVGDGPSPDTVAAGVVVLMDHDIDLDLVPSSSVWDRARRRSVYSLRAYTVEPNTCFGFSFSDEEIEGVRHWIDLEPYGFARWREDGAVAIGLGQQVDTGYHTLSSPDAGALMGRFSPGTTRGLGPEHGWRFEALRVGQADLGACRSALQAGTEFVSRPAG